MFYPHNHDNAGWIIFSGPHLNSLFNCSTLEVPGGLHFHETLLVGVTSSYSPPCVCHVKWSANDKVDYIPISKLTCSPYHHACLYILNRFLCTLHVSHSVTRLVAPYCKCILLLLKCESFNVLLLSTEFV